MSSRACDWQGLQVACLERQRDVLPAPRLPLDWRIRLVPVNLFAVVAIEVRWAFLAAGPLSRSR